jgi:act minimal PKS acyl carrier protein
MAGMDMSTLIRLLREAAAEEDVELLDGDIADTAFEDLGLDSLALFDATSGIERDYGVELTYDTFIAAKTPAELLDVVNEALYARA